MDIICSISSTYIKNDANIFGPLFFHDLDESFDSFHREEPVSPLEAFQDVVSALPGTIGEQLIEGDFGVNGNLVPKVYTDISEFGRNLDENSSVLPMYFVSYCTQFNDEHEHQFLTLKKIDAIDGSTYKLEMIFAEQDGKYYSIFPMKDEFGQQQWKVVSTTLENDIIQVYTEMVSNDDFIANTLQKCKFLCFYGRKDKTYGKLNIIETQPNQHIIASRRSARLGIMAMAGLLFACILEKSNLIESILSALFDPSNDLTPKEIKALAQTIIATPTIVWLYIVLVHFFHSLFFK